LRLPDKNTAGEEDNIDGDNSVLQGYHDWKKETGRLNAGDSHAAHAGMTGPDLAKASGQGRGNTAEPAAASYDEAQYSPLTPYFVDKNQPGCKKGSKVLIGQNGWLERTGKTPEKRKDSHKSGMLESIKRIAKDMVSATMNATVLLRPAMILTSTPDDFKSSSSRRNQG
jgi:hypothetical protein